MSSKAEKIIKRLEIKDVLVVGAAGAAFIRTSAKLKNKELDDSNPKPNDFCPDETKLFISKSLEDCQPASTHLTFWGRKITKYNLEKNDFFGTLLAIDANTKSTKRAICVLALKTAAKCICSGYNADGIRSATYNYLALRYGKFD